MALPEPNETPQLSPEIAVSRMMGAWTEHLRATKIRVIEGGTMRDSVYATGKRDCRRQMPLDLMHPEEREDPGPDGLERWQEGDEAENAMVDRLRPVGRRCEPQFAVVDNQKWFEIIGRQGRKIITGKIDGRLKFEGGPSIVFDVKRWQGARPKRFSDVLDNKWTRPSAYQMLMYLFSEWREKNPDPWGLFFVVHGKGVPEPILVRLLDHLELAEEFLAEAEIAVQARFGEIGLPPFTSNASLCRRCPHLGKSCAPPIDYGPGLRIIQDEHLEHAAEVYLQTKEAADANEDAWEDLKEGLRGVEQGLLGERFHISGKFSKPIPKYKIPQEVKEQYRVGAEPNFYLSVEPVEEDKP